MVKLKILHFSDFHNGYDQLNEFQEYVSKRDDVNLIVVSGDILGPCISGPQAQQINLNLEKIVLSTDKEIKSFEDLNDKIKYCETSKNKNLEEAARTFKEIQGKFDSKALENYSRFKEVMDSIKKPYVVIPGNWDSPIQYSKVLEENSIHGKLADLEGLTLAGYGGADALPNMVPLTRHMPYDEGTYEKFLKETQPDIIVSHMPPKGYLDGKNKIGSQALYSYIKNNEKKPKLVLCGHNHHYGVDKIGETIIVNSGNLGAYFNQKNKGSFSEVEINEKGKIKVIQYQIKEQGGVKKINPKDINEYNQDLKKTA